MDKTNRRALGVGRQARVTAAVSAGIAATLAVAATMSWLGAARAQQSEAAPAPLVSIKEVMEKTITPATNTLWNAFEPPTEDAEWQALEEAAVTLLVAAEVVGSGGTGPMDAEWVVQPAWRAFNEVMIHAGQDALAAIRARDHDALLAAGDVLYPPCEGCHQQFNPGVIGSN